jgi:hypothetical protein
MQSAGQHARGLLQVAFISVLLHAAAVKGQASQEMQLLRDLNASVNNPPAPGTSPGFPSWQGSSYCQGNQGRQLLHA